MATDPNTPRDLVRARERDLERRRAIDATRDAEVQSGQTPIPAVGEVAPRTPGTVGNFGRSLARSAREELQGAADFVARPVAQALGGLLADDAAPTVTRPQPAQVNFVDPANLPASTGEVRRGGGRTGLTRIVKTGDGTYVQTSDPNVQGQERIYDALGNRADVNTAQIIADNPNLTGTQQLAALEDAAVSDMATTEGRNRILERGRRSLERVQAMRDEAGTAAQRQFLASLDPKTRADLLTKQQTEAGLDRRAAAQLEVQREGQRAAQVNAQVGLTRLGLDQDRYERERLSNPETRDSAVREFFGGLQGLPQNERIARLTGTPGGRRIMDAATQSIRQQTGSTDVTPAQLERSSGLTRFFGAGPYTDSRSYFGDYFTPESSGFTEDDIETLRRAYLQQYVGR